MLQGLDHVVSNGNFRIDVSFLFLSRNYTGGWKIDCRWWFGIGLVDCIFFPCLNRRGCRGCDRQREDPRLSHSHPGDSLPAPLQVRKPCPIPTPSRSHPPQPVEETLCLSHSHPGDSLPAPFQVRKPCPSPHTRGGNPVPSPPVKETLYLYLPHSHPGDSLPAPIQVRKPCHSPPSTRGGNPVPVPLPLKCRLTFLEIIVTGKL